MRPLLLAALALLPACGGIPDGYYVLFEDSADLAKMPRNPDPARECVQDPEPPTVFTCNATGCVPTPACSGEIAWTCGGDPDVPLAQASCGSNVAAGQVYWCCPFVSAAGQ